jgi:hypothetical protein
LFSRGRLLPIASAQKLEAGKACDHRPRIGGRASGAQVVHSHDNGPVGNVEHCGQNQWAQRQPHGPLQSFPPTIWPRGTTVMLGGLQKTGRSRAMAFEPKQTTAEIERTKKGSTEQRMFLLLSPPSGGRSNA